MMVAAAYDLMQCVHLSLMMELLVNNTLCLNGVCMKLRRRSDGLEVRIKYENKGYQSSGWLLVRNAGVGTITGCRSGIMKLY